MTELALDSLSQERFWAKVDQSGSCWLWLAAVNNKGYGTFSVAHTKVLAHRVAFATFVGPLLPGLTIDHKCRVRNCVNPSHLQQITNKANILLGGAPSALHARKTHCVNGHPFDELNTRREGDWRACRVCDRERKRLSYYLKVAL